MSGPNKPAYRVINTTRGSTLAERSRLANAFLSRALGLMGRKTLEPGEGLIIRPCNGVTCFFMRFAIDVLFLDQEGTVCHLIPAMRPWRSSKIVRKSKQVIELPSGTAAETGTVLGDRIVIEEAVLPA